MGFSKKKNDTDFANDSGSKFNKGLTDMNVVEDTVGLLSHANKGRVSGNLM